MTFSAAPWAIDGARTRSSLARRAEFAALGRREGIVERLDLKVTALATPGQGVQISSGNAVILNRYQTNINESYVVANDATHTIPAGEMPTSQPEAKQYLVLVTIGDGEFAQVGHPWMPSEALAPEDAEDYVYVRPYVIEVPANTTSFAQLGLAYPALALARIAVPANTTTITNAMITDLRKVARPNTAEELVFYNAAGDNLLTTVTPAWEHWPGMSSNIVIPEWATKAKVDGWIESAIITGAVNGRLRVAIVGGNATATIPFNRSAPTSSPDRTGFNIGGEIDVTAIAGTTKAFRTEANVNSGMGSRLDQDTYTSVMLRIRFEEAPV